MIISSCKPYKINKFPEYCWSQISRFKNSDYTLQKINEYHKIPKKHRENAKKQAKQISYCIQLAEQYALAARSTDYIVRPLQYYYCIMNLALAEILVKQTGEVSFDRARDVHRHHGLQIKAPPKFQGNDIINILDSLKATPNFNNGQRIGTFELWRRSARKHPVVGEWIDHRNSTSTVSAILSPADTPISKIDKTGISLLDIVSIMPDVRHQISSLGIPVKSVRAKIKKEVKDDRSIFEIINHPCSRNLFDKLIEDICFSPGDIEQVRVIEVSENIFRLIYNLYHNSPLHMRMPSTFNINTEEFVFNVSDIDVNEFFLYYIYFFILGSICRYYPDQWIPHKEMNTDLFVITNLICDSFEHRIPILVLSELEQCVYISN